LGISNSCKYSVVLTAIGVGEFAGSSNFWLAFELRFTYPYDLLFNQFLTQLLLQLTSVLEPQSSTLKGHSVK
jgi:hypothetical protein